VLDVELRHGPTGLLGVKQGSNILVSASINLNAPIPNCPTHQELPPRKCIQCDFEFERKNWKDKRQLCHECKSENKKIQSKKWNDLHKLRWLPFHLKPVFPDIEDKL